MSTPDLHPLESESIAFVLTSCGRFDLLEETIATFLEFNTAPVTQYILIEDSGDERVRDVVARFDTRLDTRFEVIVNEPPIGQMASIDRAYEKVEAPYIFHCEDDWRFLRTGFIEESLALLKSDPTISVVLSRRRGQNLKHDSIYRTPELRFRGIRYRKSPPWLVKDWHGYSFNPGLRRLSDYRRLGSFAKLGNEKDASLFFKIRGMSVATLEVPACETIGLAHPIAAYTPSRSWGGLLRRAQAVVRYGVASGLRRVLGGSDRRQGH